MRSQFTAFGFIESCPKDHSLPWKPLFAVNHDCISIIMIMVESFLNHFRSWRRRNLGHIIIKDINRDCSRRQNFRSDGCMTALRELAHDISANILIGYLLLLVQGNRETIARGISDARPPDCIKGFISISRHYKRSTAGLNRFLICTVQKL